jgi:hypothetical protein
MANLFGLTNLLPGNAPNGIVGTAGNPITLPEGFILPIGKTASIAGSLSVSGVSGLFTTNINGVLSVSNSTVIGSSALHTHVITGLATFNQESTFSALKFSGSNNTSLNFYSSGSFAATLTGCTTSPTITVFYARIGNMVMLSSEGVSGTSNATAMSLSGLPAFLYPVTNKVSSHIVTNSGVNVQGRTDVTTLGSINFYIDAATTAFANTGTKGIPGLSVIYTIS